MVKYLEMMTFYLPTPAVQTANILSVELREALRKGPS